MEKKPDWNYMFIDSLKQQIAIHKITGVMYTEDKIRYTPEEANLLKQIDYQMPLSVHIVKKIFSGEIISL